MRDDIHIPPFTPTGGKVLVQQLPYRPSRTLEVISIDKADENEGIVVALSPCQYGRKYDKKKGWEHNGRTFPHEVKVGDRVFYEGSYQDEGVMYFASKDGRQKYRALDSWEIKGVLHADQPEHYESPQTGEKLPDAHPIHIIGA